MVFGYHAVGAAPTGSIDALSGLPVVPNASKTADPVQSYIYCGKHAQANAYTYSGRTDAEDEDLIATAKEWYLTALPRAKLFNGPAGPGGATGVVVFVSDDGSAAVILAGFVISFIRFSPALSAAEMKGLGAAPSSRECNAS